MRVHSTVKINRLRNPQSSYPIREAEVHENAYAYLEVDGIAILDGEGILYWVDTIVTTDAGGSIVYDNNAASGKALSAAYTAKKDEGVLKTWDPPKRYMHGVYVNLTNSLVEICYKPIARNLRSRLIVRGPAERVLVCRATIIAKSLINLISRVDVLFAPATKNLVSRLIVRGTAEENFVLRTVVHRTSNRVLVGSVTVTS